MTVQLPAVQQVLTGSSALVAIVGTRITQAIAPEDQTRPYVVWWIDSAVPENNLSDRPEEDDQLVRIDCWSTNQQQCRQMMQAAVDACEAIGHITRGPAPSYELETKLFLWSFDLEVWNKR